MSENDDLFADFHNNLNCWKNYFCELLTVHGVKQTEMNTAELLVPGSIPFEVKIAIEILKGINRQILID
jgi:hypothetical protein